MKRALLVIDVQNDFCAGGALAVPDADSVVQVCNARMANAPIVVLTQDWHPPGHSSFASTHDAAPFSATRLSYGEQTLWPDHCVQGTPGAAFHRGLHTDRAHWVVRKGTDPAIDSYSAFFENDRSTSTGLAGALRELGVSALDVVGLATDYCVRYSVLDACRLGFAVEVVRAGVRGIGEDTTQQAFEEMRSAGATIR